MIIFIDWISTSDHRNFNRSFFYALETKAAKCIVFSEHLVIPEVECFFMTPIGGRIRRAFEIFKLVLKNRKDKIVLLTYDPIFLPLFSLLKNKILVFEHNTTPEEGLSKHLVWQKLFFHRVHRLAQFPAQHGRLLQIGNNAKYIGSPIMPVKEAINLEVKLLPQFLFIAPSYRADLSELISYENLLSESIVLVKQAIDASSFDYLPLCKFTLKRLERIEFFYEGREVDAAIITIKSRLRGTGWFNDCIANRTPIIITNLDAKALFEDTFPGYPYIFLSHVESTSQLSRLINHVRSFDSVEYAKTHNARIRDRFFDICPEFSAVSKT